MQPIVAAMMMVRHARVIFASAYVKPLAGLGAAVSLSMLVFASGLAAMDHVTASPRRTSVVLPGSFGPATQSDYRAATAQRFAPQRATTR